MIIAPNIVKGVFFGTVLALLRPTIWSFGVLLSDRLHAPRKVDLEANPWVNAVVRPDHLLILVLVAFICLAIICRSSLLSFLRRCRSATVYDVTALWAATAFFVLQEPGWLARIVFAVVAVLLTFAVARLRAPFSVEPESFIKVDRPVTTFAEDKLDRKPLILSLVRRLISDGAAVVALIGAYGDGKTSILHLLESELKNRKSIVVRFKSSLPGDELTLVSTLFNSIAGQLRGRFFVHRLGRILARFARRISGPASKATSSLREMFAEPSQQDDLRELTDKLANLPVHRVVVLLDDMDRMQGSELRMLLKIIRATEGYPKLSFVCAFNKKALVDSLVRHQVIDRISFNFAAKGKTVTSGTAVGQVAADDTHAGYEYLEKFFPVQVPVPKLDDAQIGKEFDARFHQFAERNGLSTLPDDTAAFNEVFRPLWKPYFLRSLTNLRKINSYFNALNASFSLVNGEVNLMDFMCIELLRQTEPEIYEQVYKNRSLFYYPEWDILRWDERKIASEDANEDKAAETAFAEVFGKLDEQEHRFAVSLLGEIFPKVNAYRGVRGPSPSGKPNEVAADKNKHIYHPDHFTTYFSLHVQDGYVSTQEIDGLIAGASERKSPSEMQEYFITYLRSLAGLKKYRFFEKMVRHHDKLGDPQARALVVSLAREANGLAHDDFEMGPAIRLMVQLARRFKKSRQITEVLKDVVGRSTSDALVIGLLRFITDKPQEAFENPAFVDIPALKDAFATRMKAKYFVGSHEQVYDSSRTWRDWQSLISWVRVNDLERDNVRKYLAYMFERWPASIGKHILWLSPSLYSADGEKVADDLFPLNQLAELAIKYRSNSYSTEEERKAVMNVIGKYLGSPTPQPKVSTEAVLPEEVA